MAGRSNLLVSMITTQMGKGLSIKHKKPNSLQSQAMRLSTKEPCIVIRG